MTITVSYRTKPLIMTNVRVAGSNGGWAINYELRVGGNTVDTAVFSVSPYTWSFPWFKIVTVDPGTYVVRQFCTGDGGNSFSNYRTAVFGAYV